MKHLKPLGLEIQIHGDGEIDVKGTGIKLEAEELKQVVQLLYDLLRRHPENGIVQSIKGTVQ